jgi:N-carbamoylputrescine amidase
MDDLNIAAVCMRSEPGRIEQNLDRIRKSTMKAAAAGADVVCFPELSVTGYAVNDPKALCAGWETRELTAQLENTAKAAGVVLLAGLVEAVTGEKPYITQLAVGPDGLLGRHRKTHLSHMEQKVYSAGENIDVFSHGNTTFGIQLCYEAHFPEISTVMALKGADVVFIPHASPRGNGREKLGSWMRHLSARAFDNGIFVAAVNQVGETERGLTFPGVIVVLGPDGRELAGYTGQKERVLHTRLMADELKAVRRHRMRYFLPGRRPELYGRIVE